MASTQAEEGQKPKPIPSPEAVSALTNEGPAPDEQAPVEMNELPSSSYGAYAGEEVSAQPSQPHPVDQADPSTSQQPPPTAAASEPEPITSNPSSQPTPIQRKQSEALGPATDAPLSAPTTTTPSGAPAAPVLTINLLLNTGARHPYVLSEKYLSSRNASATNAAGQFDPTALSGYKLKELIWTDWRSEWEPRPTGPDRIRLIKAGKMVDDKCPLSDYKFDPTETNVVHMTIKPADFDADDDPAAKGAGKLGRGGGSIRTRDGGEGRGAGCRCVIL